MADSDLMQVTPAYLARLGRERDEAVAEVAELRAARDQAVAERDAANAQCAKAVRERKEAERQLYEFGERVDRADADALAFSDQCRDVNLQVADLTAERDRARDAAAALEAENAELRAALERIERGYAPPRDDDSAWALRRHPALTGLAASQVTAAGVLARTDPLRAET